MLFRRPTREALDLIGATFRPEHRRKAARIVTRIRCNEAFRPHDQQRIAIEHAAGDLERLKDAFLIFKIDQRELLHAVEHYGSVDAYLEANPGNRRRKAGGPNPCH